MKKFYLILLCMIAIASCKKVKFSPEGPTEIRIENITDRAFTNVIYKTSEKDNDVDTIAYIAPHEKSVYVRFTKAYPKLQVSTVINVNNVPTTYSTGTVDFTYMQYMGQDRLTYSVFVSQEATKKLDNTVVFDEPLKVK